MNTATTKPVPTLTNIRVGPSLDLDYRYAVLADHSSMGLVHIPCETHAAAKALAAELAAKQPARTA